MGDFEMENLTRAPSEEWYLRTEREALRSGSIVANEVYPRRDYC